MHPGCHACDEKRSAGCSDSLRCTVLYNDTNLSQVCMLSLWQSLGSTRPPCHTRDLHSIARAGCNTAQARIIIPSSAHRSAHAFCPFFPCFPVLCFENRASFDSCSFLFSGQSRGCLLESLTASNCWLEVLIKRRGQEAAWEPLHEAQVPDDLLAAFVQETHRTKAIPIPGESQSGTKPWYC